MTKVLDKAIKILEKEQDNDVLGPGMQLALAIVLEELRPTPLTEQDITVKDEPIPSDK